MSEIQHVPPPSRYIPAREEWLKDWCGPVEWLDTFRVPEGRWVRSAYGAGGMANGAPAERIRLDPRRPEVRDMLARALGLPESHRVGAVALCWWAGTVGRGVVDVLPTVRHLGDQDGHFPVYVRSGRNYSGWNVFVPPRALDDARTDAEIRADLFVAADLAALRADCALVTDGGLLLPPLTPGGAPILWSDE